MKKAGHSVEMLRGVPKVPLMHILLVVKVLTSKSIPVLHKLKGLTMKNNQRIKNAQNMIVLMMRWPFHDPLSHIRYNCLFGKTLSKIEDF